MSFSRSINVLFLFHLFMLISYHHHHHHENLPSFFRIFHSSHSHLRFPSILCHFSNTLFQQQHPFLLLFPSNIQNRWERKEERKWGERSISSKQDEATLNFERKEEKRESLLTWLSIQSFFLPPKLFLLYFFQTNFLSIFCSTNRPSFLPRTQLLANETGFFLISSLTLSLLTFFTSFSPLPFLSFFFSHSFSVHVTSLTDSLLDALPEKGRKVSEWNEVVFWILKMFFFPVSNMVTECCNVWGEKPYFFQQFSELRRRRKRKRKERERKKEEKGVRQKG